MRVLPSIERGIRGAVEGVFGRAFGGRLQPVEITRRLAVEIAASERGIDGRATVANRFKVRLSVREAQALAPTLPALAAQCEGELEKHARSAGWSTLGPFEVRFEPADGLATGQLDVDAIFARGWIGVRLEVITGPDRGALVHRAAQEVVIGRSAECDLRLSDIDVSRRHTAIRSDGYRLLAADLASTNGTFVVGERIAEAEIGPGARVELGRTIVQVDRTRPEWVPGQGGA